MDKQVRVKAGALAAAFLLYICAPLQAEEGVWGAFLRVLPSRVVARDAGINISLYVLKQTHEPLFRLDDGENYTSRLLTRWNRSMDSREYVFCPDTGISFGNGASFSSGFFTEYIRRLLPVFSGEGDVSGDESCTTVKFRKGRKDFLKFLSLYESAPTMPVSDTVEAGLGPFDVESMSATDIILKRKKPVARGYNSIHIFKYSGVAEEYFRKKQVLDFNKIPEPDIPAGVRNDYLHFDAVTLKSIVLLLNWPDKTLRDTLYNCINVDSFRRAYYPAQSDFVDIGNVLPMGVPGARPGLPAQNCRVPAGLVKLKSPLIFMNLSSSSEGTLVRFFDEFKARTGIAVTVRNIKNNDMQKSLFVYPRGYNLTVVAMDAVRPDHSAFFDYIVKKDGFFDFSVPGLGKPYSELLDSVDASRTAVLGSELASRVESARVVLPLFQVRRRFYYPREIRNLMAGRGFLEYPEIAEFRW